MQVYNFFDASVFDFNYYYLYNDDEITMIINI